MFNLYLFICMILSFIILFLMFCVSFFANLDKMQTSSFECGFYSYHFSRFSFSMHFFMICLMFLFLDLEVCFMFFFLILSKNNYITCLFLFLFLMFLFLTLLMEIKENNIEWIN